MDRSIQWSFSKRGLFFVSDSVLSIWVFLTTPQYGFISCIIRFAIAHPRCHLDKSSEGWDSKVDFFLYRLNLRKCMTQMRTNTLPLWIGPFLFIQHLSVWQRHNFVRRDIQLKFLTQPNCEVRIWNESWCDVVDTFEDLCLDRIARDPLDACNVFYSN